MHYTHNFRRSSLAAPVFLAISIFVPGTSRAQDQRSGKAALYALQEAFTAVAEEVEPAVVTITARKSVRPIAGLRTRGEDDPLGGLPLGRGSTQRRFRAQGTGSGVIISTDGWILTNEHVVSGAEKVLVKLIDGREFDGTVRRDYRTDLALIKINASNVRAARLGDSDKVKVGQWAIVIGSPFRYEGTFSLGVISSLLRRQEIRSASGAIRVYPNMIQTDAAINPGNSGGPLINIEGEVVGINTAIESDSGGSVGIGFAIPINTARMIAEQLKEKGKVSHGYLGIDPGTVTPRLASAYRVTSGALVQGEPSEGSPAAKAGLQADDVITEIDGKAVKNELDLRTIVSRVAPGTAVSIVYVRDGVEQKVKTIIAEAPETTETGAGEPATDSAELGIDVSSTSKEALKKAGLSESLQGVIIKSIDAGSSIAESEMDKGDVILKVNNTPTPSANAFNEVVKGIKSGDVLRVLWTGKRGRTVAKRVAVIIVD